MLKAILFILLARVSICQNLCKAIGLYIVFTITVYLTYHNSTKGKNDQWLLGMHSQCWRGKMLTLKKKKKEKDHCVAFVRFGNKAFQLMRGQRDVPLLSGITHYFLLWVVHTSL